MTIMPKTQFRILLATGIVLALAPLWGVLGTIAMMVHSFGQMGHAGPEQAEHLANTIGQSFYSTAIGLVLGFIGIAAIIVSCIFLKRIKREEAYPNQA